MGVEYDFYNLVGIKGDWNDFKMYYSKNDPDYMWDKEHGELDKYNNILFKDYMPPKYTIIEDCMGSDYSYVGRVISKTSEYMDEIPSISLSVDKLNKIINDVYNELTNLGIKYNKEDIKFHSFVDFH